MLDIITKNILVTDTKRIFSLIDAEASPERILFFDIETTGLSADFSYLYQIGIMYLSDNELVIRQLIAEDFREENLLLTEFTELLNNYDILVHYNGTGFDIPYIKKKLAAHGISSVLTDLKSCDLYKRLKPYKEFFRLSSMTQKSVERFLNINRKDEFSGGELIAVYNKYLARAKYERLRAGNGGPEYTADSLSGLALIEPADAATLLEMLRLHNFEDVCNMLPIAGLLALPDFFKNAPPVSEYISCNSKSGEPYICFSLDAEHAVTRLFTGRTISRPVFRDLPPVYIGVASQKLNIYVPLYVGELKLFHSDPENYYYLPSEDTAIHKSVAAFTDPAFRKKATARTCYTKHSGTFLPQLSEIFTPALKTDDKSNITFFTLPPFGDCENNKIRKYIADLLACFD